ncbi:MAG: DUF1697 domain-containing protein [Candidatus Dormibacteraceae bacterium]
MSASIRYVALLRGINVGANKRIAMADLRELVTSLGHRDVGTLLQSGNVVFSTPGGDDVALAGQLEAALAIRFGFQVSVLVRTRDEIMAALAGNPIPEALEDPAHYLLTFLRARPAPERIAALDPTAYLPDRFAFGDRLLYAWYRDGVLESRLSRVNWDRVLGVTTTARNWTTVSKLQELL